MERMLGALQNWRPSWTTRQSYAYWSGPKQLALADDTTTSTRERDKRGREREIDYDYYYYYYYYY